MTHEGSDKVNKYQCACKTNGVSFSPFIMESNGNLHPTSKQFLEDLFLEDFLEGEVRSGAEGFLEGKLVPRTHQ